MKAKTLSSMDYDRQDAEKGDDCMTQTLRPKELFTPTLPSPETVQRELDQVWKRAYVRTFECDCNKCGRQIHMCLAHGEERWTPKNGDGAAHTCGKAKAPPLEPKPWHKEYKQLFSTVCKICHKPFVMVRQDHKWTPKSLDGNRHVCI